MSGDGAAPLQGRRVLVAEDEYLIAIDLAEALTGAGAEVVGPAGAVSQALELIAAAGDRLDGAILDINLRGELVYPVADELAARRIPFVFTTGYDGLILPARHAGVPLCEKPIRVGAALRLLADQLARRPTAADLGSD